jgi:hypothetical protein
MANNILTAKVAQVPFGSFKTEGLMFEDGSFGISLIQINQLISFSTSNNVISRDLKRFLGKDFSPSKVKVEGLKQLINSLSLPDFEVLLAKTDRAGNLKAQELRDSLVGLSLIQLFSDAFNVKFDQDERQQHLINRQLGKVTRRKLTDAIKDWYNRNPEGTSRPYSSMYAATTNAIYEKLWGMVALQMEEYLECGRNQSRDNMCSDCLQTLERAEANVCEYIDLDNIKPIDAVQAANIRPSRVPLTKK